MRRAALRWYRVTRELLSFPIPPGGVIAVLSRCIPGFNDRWVPFSGCIPSESCHGLKFRKLAGIPPEESIFKGLGWLNSRRCFELSTYVVLVSRTFLRCSSVSVTMWS